MVMVVNGSSFEWVYFACSGDSREYAGAECFAATRCSISSWPTTASRVPAIQEGENMLNESRCLLLIPVFFSLVGCGGGKESAVKDFIDSLNERTAIFATIKDDKSANEAIPKLRKAKEKEEAALKKLKAINADKDKTPPPGVEEARKLYDGGMDALANRVSNDLFLRVLEEGLGAKPTLPRDDVK